VVTFAVIAGGLATIPGGVSEVKSLIASDPEVAILHVPPVGQVTIRVYTPPTAFADSIYDDSYTYFFAKRPAQVNEPTGNNGCKSNHDWASRNDGSDVGKTWFEITLQGNRPSDVTVRNLKIDVLSDVPTPDGWYYPCRTGGGDGLDDGLIVDLDLPNPNVGLMVATDGPDRSTRHGCRVIQHPYFTEPVSACEPPVYTLRPGEQQSLDVFAFVQTHHLVRWRLTADVVSDSSVGPLVIDDHGRPFQTVGFDDHTPMLSWSSQTSTWEPL